MSAMQRKNAVRPERSEAKSKDGPSTSALRTYAQSERQTKSRVKTIGEICRLEYGSNLPERDRKAGNVPVYGSNGIVGSHDRAITNGATLIVGRKGSIEQVAFSEVPCWPIDTTYYVDETCTACNLAWLSLLLRSLQLSELNKASGVPGLNRDDVYALRVVVPEPDEQRRIAARLKAQLAAVEQARKAAQAQLADLEALPARLLAQAFDSSDEGASP